MAKKASRNGRAAKKRASGVAGAIQRRFGGHNTTHTDKRKRRQDRNSWRKDHDRNGD